MDEFFGSKRRSNLQDTGQEQEAVLVRCEARARASIARLIHDRMLRGARVSRRGLGGVPVMRAARGWVPLVGSRSVPPFFVIL